jgi:hypothetical protein
MDTRLTLEAVEAMVAEQRRKAEQPRQRLDGDGPSRQGRRFNREIARAPRFVAKATQR